MTQHLWVIAAVIVLGVLHAVVFRYIRRHGQASDDASNGNGGVNGQAPEGPVTRREDSALVCSTCGTNNDPAFTFCRQCQEKLAA